MKKNYALSSNSYSLTLGWLYPELMSTYGDGGNIITLTKRCEWQGIRVDIKSLDIGYKVEELESCDLLFMGGAQDTQQSIVAKDFTKEKVAALKEFVEEGKPGLYICGAYQFLGNYYKEANGNKIPGLGILDLYTEHPGENSERLIGNIVVDVSDFLGERNHEWKENLHPVTLTRTLTQAPKTLLVGFENHGGRTYLGEGIKPLGKVVKGYGNNGKDQMEGAIYKNSLGSYLHGPILPKNPQLSDFLISKALEIKYGEKIELEELDDSLGQKAHNFIIDKLI